MVIFMSGRGIFSRIFRQQLVKRYYNNANFNSRKVDKNPETLNCLQKSTEIDPRNQLLH
jgi:hypothetical protein